MQIPSNLSLRTELRIAFFLFFQVTYLLMDVKFVGSVELIIGSGRYSNWRLLSTSVLVSNVTFSLYIPVSYAPLDLQVIFHSSDKFLILRIISTVKSNRRLSKCMMTFFTFIYFFPTTLKILVS